MKLALVNIDELSGTFEDFVVLQEYLKLGIVSEEKLLALRKQDFEAGRVEKWDEVEQKPMGLLFDNFEDYLLSCEINNE